MPWKPTSLRGDEPLVAPPIFLKQNTIVTEPVEALKDTKQI